MTKAQFLSNNRGIGPNGSNVQNEILENVYDSIKAQEIQIEQREYIQGVAHEGWLLKQGGKVKTWKKRWVICSGSVLYYFETPKDNAPKGLVPLENVVARTTSGKPFAFALVSADDGRGVIKSAKAKAGGMKHGSHGKFIFAADSDAERTRWLDAIQANSKASEYQSRIAAIARRAPVSSPAKKNTATKPPLVTCPPSREQVDARGLDID